MSLISGKTKASLLEFSSFLEVFRLVLTFLSRAGESPVPRLQENNLQKQNNKLGISVVHSKEPSQKDFPLW